MRFWTLRTSYCPSPTEVTSTGAAETYFIRPDLGTMPLMWPVVAIDPLPVSGLDKFEKPAGEELELQRGLQALMSLELAPDPPTEADLRSDLEYNLP